ncbi:MAG: hypothetical protein J6N72_09905, partial [Psychrobacter sp.]|nr:hypothetical protein [Psychrobacter sp.]
SFLNVCYRIDSKTTALIDKGFVVFDGEAYFESEEHALEFINSCGHHYTMWHEVSKAAKKGVIKNCYYKDWSQ